MGDDEPRADGDGEEPRVSCPTCGHGFTTAEVMACHPSCPMSAGCAMVRCPACGTEFPRPGPVTRWLERLLRRG